MECSSEVAGYLYRAFAYIDEALLVVNIPPSAVSMAFMCECVLLCICASAREMPAAKVKTNFIHSYAPNPHFFGSSRVQVAAPINRPMQASIVRLSPAVVLSILNAMPAGHIILV